MSTTTQNLYRAKIADRFLLNKSGSTRKTYHITLKLPSPISYKVGDSIAIYPTNNPEAVEKILSFFPKIDEVIHKKTKESCCIRKYLTKHANISKITANLIKQVATKTSCEKLQTLLLSNDKQALQQYLEKRDLIDILEEYPSALLAQEMIDSLLPMLPRYYSIASSNIKDPYHIHLTVAHVTYSTLGKERVGIGSHFLCELSDNETEISFFVQPSNGFTLPNSHVPIIMIGPGTGIAPFRAFIEERLHTNATGENWLFFGERNKDTDFYYEDFLKPLVESKKLYLSTAFSRDQEEKVYVQHKMLEQKQKLFSWIEQGAIIYVCGDAKKMAKDVNNALLQILSSEKGFSEEEAKTYLKNLRKEKRYLTDVY